MSKRVPDGQDPGPQGLDALFEIQCVSHIVSTAILAEAVDGDNGQLTMNDGQ